MKDQNQDNPLVSIMLMAYHREHYLPALLDSFLTQTFKDFELVVFDDGLSDETRMITESYIKKDARLRYVRPEKNLNVPASFKMALNLARGKYFMWVEDDNLYDKQFLEDCVSVYRSHPEFIVVFTGMVDIDKNGNVFQHPNPSGYIPIGATAYQRLKRQILNYFSDGKNQLIFGLWKRETILDNPLFGPNSKDDQPPYYWGFENYFVFRNLAKGPVGFVPETLFFRRSRVPEEYRPPHAFLPRLTVTFYHRLEKIFRWPYFYYIMHRILKIKELSMLEKIKLLGWNFYVMKRLFLVRKI